MRSLFINIVIIGFLGIGLFVITQNAELIKSFVGTPQQLIAGVSTSEKSTEKETLPEELVEDAEKKLDDVKKNALDTTVEEIILFFGKSGKIVEDIKNAQKTATEYLSQ